MIQEIEVTIEKNEVVVEIEQNLTESLLSNIFIPKSIFQNEGDVLVGVGEGEFKLLTKGNSGEFLGVKPTGELDFLIPPTTDASGNPVLESTDELIEGIENLYFTDERARIAVEGLYPLVSDIAAVATSGSYNDLSSKPDLTVFDNISEHASAGAFPSTGEADKFYLAQDTGILYRWAGSGYTIISAELAIGETASTAYRGDRGKASFEHISVANNPHGVSKSQVGLGSVPNTDFTGEVSANTSKLATIENNADVTNTARVTAAGALMDSEVNNLEQVKTFNSGDYATALGADDNYVTNGEKVVIGNTSGENTGDQEGDGVTIMGSGTAGDPFVAATTGTGDMLSSVYDPTSKLADSFSMGNMVETVNKKVLTNTERTNLLNQSNINTGDETLSTIKDKLGITTLSGSNTGDQELSGLVSKTGNETIEGVKTFSSSPIVPTPTADMQASTKKYVDDSLVSAGAGDMLLSAVQSVTGKKTFDTAKIAVKGSSTGVNTIANANTGATNYIATLPAKTGIVAMTSDITGTNSGTNTGDQDLSGKVDKISGKGLSAEDYTSTEKNKLSGIATGANVGVVPNAGITGATKTKITYDAKGLVTAGAAATTADIADSANKRYCTDAQKTVIGNTSGTNTGDQDISGIATNAGKITAIETKTDFITVAQAVDLDTMESNIATNNAKVGITPTQASNITTNNSKVTYPSSASTKLATIETNADVTNTARVTAAGALMDTEVTNLAQVKAFNNTDYAPSLGADDNYVTDTEKVVIGNQSNTNTGDETLSTIKSKLGITTLSGSNTGDNATNTKYSGLEASKQNTLGFTPYNATNPSGYTSNVGDVTLAGAQALTNKTLTDAVNNVVTPAVNSIGYLAIPQNSKSAAYTTVLADSGKHILHPSADTAARTFTIPANSSVAYPIGTAITFVNQNAGGVITIAITTDTIRLAGEGTTGNRTLAANGVATAIKITATEWIVSGTSLS
jgi:hypothetical protein